VTVANGTSCSTFLMSEIWVLVVAAAAAFGLVDLAGATCGERRGWLAGTRASYGTGASITAKR